MKFLYAFLLVATLASCGSDFGHQVRGGNLTVYFENEQDQEKAEMIAKFWKEKGLLTGETQDLQLIKDGDWYELNIIANDPNKVKPMPFAERKVLIGLQKEIQEMLNEDHLQIVICNAKFEPIYNINE